MLLWTYPGTVTGPCDRATFSAELDLGLRWRHPTAVRIAGLSPHRGSPHARRIAELLPEGAKFLALAQPIGHDAELRAHVILPGGADVASLIREKQPELPAARYGGRWNGKWMWRWPATVLRACDADTITCDIDMGVPTHLQVNVRVAHVNAPETGTAEGQAATVWAEQALPSGMTVELTSRGMDKWQRPLAEITLADGRDYGARLIDAGHAVLYEGGPR
ncbi:thermonuclease family protein [Actinoplanes sp. CA-051413]|uniref:thermonuclease family protein n=1 Tax=Actinoplanes sp. CA-051413 TaxID=3239899 RepID=UPI003D98EE5E